MEEKDLGVLISSNLRVAEHCYEPYCKANRMFERLKRTVKYRNPIDGAVVQESCSTSF